MKETHFVLINTLKFQNRMFSRILIYKFGISNKYSNTIIINDL